LKTLEIFIFSARSAVSFLKGECHVFETDPRGRRGLWRRMDGGMSAVGRGGGGGLSLGDGQKALGDKEECKMKNAE
jgi:hypothetical protein